MESTRPRLVLRDDHDTHHGTEKRIYKKNVLQKALFVTGFFILVGSVLAGLGAFIHKQAQHPPEGVGTVILVQIVFLSLAIILFSSFPPSTVGRMIQE